MEDKSIKDTILEKIKWDKVISVVLLCLSAFAISFVAGTEINIKQLIALSVLLLIVFVVYVSQLYIFNLSKNKEITNIIKQYDTELQIKSINYSNELQKLVGKYESKLAQHSDWFFSHERLAGIEKDYRANKMDDIWIASSNLDYEKENSPFINAIKNNLKEGISYHYIVPKKQLRLLKIRVKSLQDFAKNTKGDISFIPVDDESLFLFLSNIVIYKDKTTDYPEAYKELIIDNELMKRAWMKVNENNSDFGELYSKFEEYVNKN